MKQKRIFAYAASVLILLSAMGIGGFFLGKYTEVNRSQQDKALSILLHRSDLEGLGKIDGPIYVSGHKSPDSDTVGSAIAYATLLGKLGYDAQPVILGPVNPETAFILQAARMEPPALLEDAAGKNMVLVDHSEYTQSADGLTDAHIISIIDHHGDGTVTTGHPMIYDARPLGSTATIIWIRYQDYGVDLDRQTAHVLLGAVLSDTKNLKADTTTWADREAVKALSAMADVPDPDAFYQSIYKASISYDGMTNEEIYFSDYKEYACGSTNYAIACVNSFDEADAHEMINRMKETVPGMLKTTGMDMAFAQISIFHDDLSITYIVPSDAAASEVLAAAFQDAAVYDGTSYRLEPGISRKQVLVPAITNVLMAYPKE